MTGISKQEKQKLSQYKGTLIHNYRHDLAKDENGEHIKDETGAFVKKNPDPILRISDTRDIEMERLKNIDQMWTRFDKYTFEIAPQQMQNNAALGLLSEEERAALLSFLNAMKAEYSARKTRILASNSNDEIANIAVAAMPESVTSAAETLQNS